MDQHQVGIEPAGLLRQEWLSRGDEHVLLGGAGSTGASSPVSRVAAAVSIQFEAATDPQDAADLFSRLLGQIAVTITYHSIYRDEHQAVLKQS